MGYSQENGYTPLTIPQIMDLIIADVNTQFGTTYTAETFAGTGFYKFFYILAQRVSANEIKLSEIFLKLQDYFRTINETIVEPKVTYEGLLAVFSAAGYTASIKKPTVLTAGQIDICVDVLGTETDYADLKLEIATIIKDYTVAGTISNGAQSQTITLTNGQSFDFKFHLPTRTETALKITTTTSRNNKLLIDSPDDIKAKLLTNIAAKYSLGKDFEPEVYFTSADAPYAADILLEYSFDDGATWLTNIYTADFDDLLEFSVERITVVQS